MTALRTTATDRPEEPRMSDNPMAAALGRLRREHPDLPTDGGRVWEPVEPDEEHHTVDGIRYLCHRDDHYCPTAPADACTGSPCGCGHDAGADCHPQTQSAI